MNLKYKCVLLLKAVHTPSVNSRRGSRLSTVYTNSTVKPFHRSNIRFFLANTLGLFMPIHACRLFFKSNNQPVIVIKDEYVC